MPLVLATALGGRYFDDAPFIDEETKVQIILPSDHQAPCLSPWYEMPAWSTQGEVWFETRQDGWPLKGAVRVTPGSWEWLS